MAGDQLDPDYVALIAKIDAFTTAVQQQRQDVVCRSGCSACCRVQLTLSDVEANALRVGLSTLDEARRAILAQNLSRPTDECVLLDAEGRCLAYRARPAVCRTQGMALSYPSGTVPAEALSGRGAKADLTWCPLNFVAEPPSPGQTLDAERVDRMLALINQRISDEPLRRTSLADIAREMVDAHR